MENIVTGKRYERIPDEVIKYALGLYGELYAPVDKKVMKRIEQLPRTKELRGWKPEDYDKPIEEFRKEFGPDLDDDDLILTILIPGYKKDNLATKPVIKSPPANQTPVPKDVMIDFPAEFSVEVDGEQFEVKVSPKWTTGPGDRAGDNRQDLKKSAAPEEKPAGAVVAGIAGLVISIDVKEGDQIQEGDQVAVIEAMKMMRTFLAPCGGVVKKIFVEANQTIDTEDILMIVE
jgi:biotin carboxyl carrier protein